MSRTDHARKPRVCGHRVTIRHVRMFGGRTADQAVCSCGCVGPTQAIYADAQRDAYEHKVAATYQAVAS